MKESRNSIIELLSAGYCTPRLVGLAKKLVIPMTTVQYNVKQMEKDGVIRAYKAVFDYRKIDMGICNFVLISLAADEYSNPERIAAHLAGHGNVESVDIITGDSSLMIKVRTKDMDEYYQFVKNVLSTKGIANTRSMTSMKQVKTEFVKT